MDKKFSGFSAVFEASAEEWPVVMPSLRRAYLKHHPLRVDLLSSTKSFLTHFFRHVWFHEERGTAEFDKDVDIDALAIQSHAVYEKEILRLYDLGRGSDVLTSIATRGNSQLVNFVKVVVLPDYKNREPQSFSCVAHVLAFDNGPRRLLEPFVKNPVRELVRFAEIGVYNAAHAIGGCKHALRTKLPL